MTIKNDSKEKGLWLKSEWDFTPDEWACIGFKTEGRRDGFFKRTGEGAIIAFFIVRGRSKDKDMSGKVVGFFELSAEKDKTQKFICPEFWDKHQLNLETNNRWLHGVGISRAWLVNKDDWEDVEFIFPNTYTKERSFSIGAHGRKVTEADFNQIKRLRIKPVKVYGQPLPDAEPEIETAGDLLRLREIQLYGYDGFPAKPEPIRAEDSIKPSRAGPINKGNYSVGEIDGPRHLYILKLEGSPADWLGYDCQDKIIIKVGFSKSPHERCASIQSNYPKGQFKWGVMFPKQFNNPPAPDGNTAKIGEDAMKKFLKDNAEPLDGEFYLVPKNLCKPCFDAGLSAINYPKTKK